MLVLVLIQWTQVEDDRGKDRESVEDTLV